MIKNYRDYAANERTYLAWVRTGITVAVFGFVIEKFELFLETLSRMHAEQLAGQVAISSGVKILSVVLVVVGVGVILLSTLHFVRTRRAIETESAVDYQDLFPAYVLSGLLAAMGLFLMLVLLRFV